MISRFLSVLLFFLSGFSFLPAFAEEAEVPPVLVSATRSEQSLVTLPAAMVTVSKEAIATSGARNLGEILRGLGGLQVSDTFGDGSRAGVSMRGFGAETANANVLVMVDGRRLNNSDIANPDLNSVALNDIERIEIIQGSAGTLYGDQAVGGVVNIITRRPDAPRGFAELELGSYSKRAARGGYSERLESGLGYRVGVEVRDSDNYRDQNVARYRNASIRGDREYGSGLVFVEFQYVDDRLQTPGALFANEVAIDRQQSVDDFDGDFSNTLTRIARVGISQVLDDNWSLEAEATRRSVDTDFRIGFRGSPATDDNRQERKLVSVNPRLIGSYPMAGGEMVLTLGYDQEQTDYYLASIFGTQTSEQTARAVYGQVVLPLDNAWTATAGLREAKVDNSLDDPFAGLAADADLDDSVTVGELGLSWQPTAAWRVFGRMDENFRFVKVDEQSQAGGEVLKTQTGVSKEFGIEWKQAQASAQVLIYQLDLDNEITFDPTTFTNVGLDSTRRRGVNLDASLRISPALRLAFGLSRIDADDQADAVGDRRIPLVAESLAKVAVDYRISDTVHAYTDVHYVGERILSGDFSNQLDPLPAFTVINLSLAWHHSGWDMSLRVNNLLDEEYSEFAALGFDSNFDTVQSFQPSPERHFSVAVRYDF